MTKLHRYKETLANIAYNTYKKKLKKTYREPANTHFLCIFQQGKTCWELSAKLNRFHTDSDTIFKQNRD